MPSPLLLHDDIYNEVTGRIVAAANAIKLGCQCNPTTGSGPVITTETQNRIWEMVDRAESSSDGKLRAGGKSPTA